MAKDKNTMKLFKSEEIQEVNSKTMLRRRKKEKSEIGKSNYKEKSN